MESIITFLVVLFLSAIGTWIKKLSQNQQDDSTAPPRTIQPMQPGQPRPTPAPRKSINWEDEMRRLLGDEIPTVIPTQRPRPTIPNRPVPAPPVVTTAQAPAQPAPVIRRFQAPEIVPLPVPSVEKVSNRQLATMDESRQAYERASQLDATAAERIKRVPGHHVASTSEVTRVSGSREATHAIMLLRNAHAAREAIIVSLILGPPKSLEPAA